MKNLLCRRGLKKGYETMKEVKDILKDTYTRFIHETKEELQNSKELLKVIDCIEYKTKKNGRPYTKTVDNIVNTCNCHLRYDRHYKWLDVHGADMTKMYLSHYVAVFDCRQSLDGLKKDISDYRKRLVKQIEENEHKLTMSFEEFTKGGF